ncbi:MAG: hypothetical protein V4582_20210 [Pseudomonadota bacterium]
MEKDTAMVRRQTATKTLLMKIRRAAKAIAREGVAYQSALEHLAIQAGYGGWTDLQRAADSDTTTISSFSLPEMDRGLRGAPRLDRKPNWNRSESELQHWFERPFVDVGGPHDHPMVLCLDGRVWDEPSRITDWFDEDDHGGVIEFAKERFSFFMANSKWQVAPSHNKPEGWNIVLHWTHSVASGIHMRETVYVGENKESALRRERVLRDIRQQRIREFDNLFSIPELFRS